MSDKQNPCPECGGKHVSVVKPKGETTFIASCADCGFKIDGAAYTKKKFIVEVWNRVPPKDLEEFFARCQFYEPFTMGGNVWRHVAYPVVGIRHTLRDGTKVFSFEQTDQSGYSVHELVTGGFIARKTTRAEALKKAARLLSITPDFAEQAKKLGPAVDLPKVTREEAERRLKKSEKK